MFVSKESPGGESRKWKDTVHCVKCCVVLMYTLETLNVYQCFLSTFIFVWHWCLAQESHGCRTLLHRSTCRSSLSLIHTIHPLGLCHVPTSESEQVLLTGDGEHLLWHHWQCSKVLMPLNNYGSLAVLQDQQAGSSSIRWSLFIYLLMNKIK